MSLDRYFSVQVKKSYESVKNAVAKTTDERQYPRPVISIGWAQVPSQAQLVDELAHAHTSIQRDRQGDSERKITG